MKSIILFATLSAISFSAIASNNPVFKKFGKCNVILEAPTVATQGTFDYALESTDEVIDLSKKTGLVTRHVVRLFDREGNLLKSYKGSRVRQHSGNMTSCPTCPQPYERAYEKLEKLCN